MPREPKGQERPRDTNQLAKLMVDILTGEVEDREPTPEERGVDPAASWTSRVGAPSPEFPSRRSTPSAGRVSKGLQILDDDQLLAALSDHCEHVARRAVVRIVTDRDGHCCGCVSMAECSVSLRA